MANPIKVLIVMRDTQADDLTDHHPDPTTAPLLCKVLLDSGYEVQICNNLERLKNPDRTTGLPYFDAVVFHGKLAIRDQAALDALVHFVTVQGKGLVVIHVASASFAVFDNTMPKWIELIGTAWVYARPGQPPISHHPEPPQSIEVTVEDTRHPIMAGIPREFNLQVDELYQGLREAAHGDTGHLVASGTDTRPVGGVMRSITEPAAFALERGKGRVFNMHLGHSVSAQGDPNFQRIIAQSVRWVASQD
jgi:type 1 glutamine amidotransferase